LKKKLELNKSQFNVLHFKQNSKIIAISKYSYLKPVSNSSYEENDRIFVGDFLSRLKAKEMKRNLPYISDFSTQKVNLDVTEMNVLYNLAGYILSRISKNNHMNYV